MHSHSHCHEKGYPVWWLRRDERGARSVVEYVRHDWSEEGVEGERREPPCLPSRVQLTGCLLHCAAQGRRRGPPACGPGRPDRAGTITSARPDDPPATPSAAARRRCGRSTFASRLTIGHLCYRLTASPSLQRAVLGKQVFLKKTEHRTPVGLPIPMNISANFSCARGKKPREWYLGVRGSMNEALSHLVREWTWSYRPGLPWPALPCPIVCESQRH